MSPSSLGNCTMYSTWCINSNNYSNEEKHILVTFLKDKVVAVASEVSAIQLFSFPSGECSGKLEGHTQRSGISAMVSYGYTC